MNTKPELLITLCPSFPHFGRFARDPRLLGIRLNSARLSPKEIAMEIYQAKGLPAPLWFDVKGRQLRVTEALPNKQFCDIRLNHPIEVDTPTPILFKAGADHGLLGEVLEDGHRLLFKENPHYMVHPGESLHIRHPSLKVKGSLFTDLELEKIQLVKDAGIKRWFLSYVEEQRDIDQFRELVGKDAEIRLKIESKRGLEFVAKHFRKDSNLCLVAACGDLFVEVEQPHHILDALELIVSKDPEAIAASRLLLNIVQEPVPSLADLAHLAWLYDKGYRTFMLCDELCLKEEWLSVAANVFDAFRESYPKENAPKKPWFRFW